MTLKESSVPEAGYVPGGPALRDTLITSLRVDAGLFAIVSFYCASVVLLGYLYGASGRVSLTMYNSALVVIVGGFISLGVCRMAWRLVRTKPHGLFRADSWLTLALKRVWAALPIVLTLPVFFAAYNSAKSLIPVVHPFAWDGTFARLDEVIHGTQPWRLLHPILRYPVATYVMDCVYQIWFLVMMGVTFWQASNVSRPELRRQFLWTYLLAWILLGTVLATWLSSAGPSYYERVCGKPSPYADLVQHLHAVNTRYPLSALTEQRYLWGLYKNGQTQLVSGISAMPSMHVSMVVLYALVGWRVSRATGITLTIFAVLTAVASIYLGWHYAVDAYTAALGTMLIWWGVGLLLRRGCSARRPVIQPSDNEVQRRVISWR